MQEQQESGVLHPHTPAPAPECPGRVSQQLRHRLLDPNIVVEQIWSGVSTVEIQAPGLFSSSEREI